MSKFNYLQLSLSFMKEMKNGAVCVCVGGRVSWWLCAKLVTFNFVFRSPKPRT